MKKYLAMLTGLASLCATASLAQSLDYALTGDMFEPSGVAVDVANNAYYITDTSNNRIIRYAVETSVRTNVAGLSGVGGAGFVDGPGHVARFSNPQGIIPARGGYVIADSGNHAIRFLALDGTVSTLAGGKQGSVDGVGTNASFNSPAGLSADSSGNIYVADLLNNSIRKLDSTNKVTTVATGFRRPSGVSYGDGGRLFVADSGNHSIKVVETDGTVNLYAGSGSPFVSGTNDAVIATQAKFNNPRGLLWVGGTTGLLVSDSGNRVLRKVYYNTLAFTNTVETIPATVNAGLIIPVGLARDNDGNFLVADSGANAIRRLVATLPQKPVGDPVIGTVELITNPLTGETSATLFPITGATFNNDVVMGILAESGTETFYTTDGSEPSSATGSTPPPFYQGQPTLPPSFVDQSLAGAVPSFTIKAISSASGRKASAVVSARVTFQVANPATIGNNPGSVMIDCVTRGAVMYYTTDGSDPIEGVSKVYPLGDRLNIVDGTADVTLKVRAFKRGYNPSRIVSQVYKYENLQISSIGVVRDFIAGPGSTVIIPVDVKLNTNDVLRSLQFRLDVSPVGTAPLIPAVLDAYTLTPVDFVPLTLPIDPAASPITNLITTVKKVYSTAASTGIEVGYLGVDSTLLAQGAATVAVLSVPISASAKHGDKYTVSVMYPSATSDRREDYIQLTTLTNRSITVSTNITLPGDTTLADMDVSYVVGDTAQSSWYNSGEFGNGNLNNNDVNNAFTASLGLYIPYEGSVLFDSMDAWPFDTLGTVGGDGIIQYLDWVTTFERSLRVDGNNWRRYWGPGGVHSVINTTLNGLPLTPAEEIVAPSGLWQPQVSVVAGYVENAQPGSTVDVPLYLKVHGDNPVSGFQFRATVIAERDAPSIATGPVFVPQGTIPPPAMTLKRGNTIGCGWVIDTIKPALTGETLIGHILFTVPAEAKQGQAYVIRVSHTGGSRTKAGGQYAAYNFESLPGSVWVQSPMLRPPSVLSDEWKMKFFGSLDNPLADPYADPDGDGKNNLQEFLSGTGPAKLRFHMLNSEWKARRDAFHLRWFGQPGKKYLIEASPDSINGPWLPVGGSVTGTGDLLDVDGPKVDAQSLFYRVREMGQ